MKWRRRAFAVFTLVMTLGTLAASSLAGAASDDRSAAEALVKDIEASPRKALAAEPLARVRSALERGAQLRSSGDEPHARLADGLARTWAETARDLVRAADTEEKAAAARTAATDAGAQADRERALLEEGIAQSGRLRAQLEQLERESKEQPARTSAAANDADGGAARPKTGAAKSGGTAAPAPTKPAPAPANDGGAR